MDDALPPEAFPTDLKAASAKAHKADILIVGAGFSGLIMALEARRRGFDDIVIVEKAEDIGGTWRENTYPGVACDIPAHLYCIAARPEWDWQRKYASGAEIWEYMKDVARHEELYALISFGRTVTGAAWDENQQRWHVSTAEGESYVCRVLVSAMGPLHVPKIPNFPGLGDFRGPAFHSARWDHDADLAGKRIAVIGAGASAVQFVPEIAEAAGRLTIYQRTPPWVLPRHAGQIPGWLRRLYAHIPGLRRLVRRGQFELQEMQHGVFRGNPRAVRLARRLALKHMARTIRDPAMRAKLTPTYQIGCKRVLFSDTWYPVLARSHVEVVTQAVAEVREDSLVTEDGVSRPADVLIFGTGFQVTETVGNLLFRGRGGQPITQAWREGIVAYLGASVHGFPNLFFMLGPNTGLGHNSVLLMVEAQAEHIARVLAEMRHRKIEAIEPRPEIQAGFADEMRQRLAGMVWQTGGCSSWYKDVQGQNPTLWPGTVPEFCRRTRASGLSDYRPVGT